MPIEQKEYGDDKPLYFRRKSQRLPAKFSTGQQTEQFVSELQRGHELISKSWPWGEGEIPSSLMGTQHGP